MSLEWRGEEAKLLVENLTLEALERGAEAYLERLKDEVSVTAVSGKVSVRSRVTGRKRKINAYTPSRPGEPPRKRTGKLQKWIMYEIDRDKLRARVGVNIDALYGLFLEFGTRHMKARPWLLATMTKYLDFIRAAILMGSGSK